MVDNQRKWSKIKCLMKSLKFAEHLNVFQSI